MFTVILGYYVLGLVYVGTTLPGAVKEATKQKGGEVAELAPLFAALLGAFVVAPFWPMFLASKIVAKLHTPKADESCKNH